MMTVTSVGGGGTSVEAGGHQWRQGNIGYSWGMLVGGREQSWELVCIDGGQGTKVGTGVHLWGLRNVNGGWGTKVGDGEQRWKLGNINGGAQRVWSSWMSVQSI